MQNIKKMRKTPDLIIFDTFSRYFDGDENQTADVIPYMNNCQTLINTFGCSLILIHHVGQDSAKQKRERGSSSIKAALDLSILCEKNRSGTMTLSPEKVKDGIGAKPVVGRLENVTLPPEWDYHRNGMSSSSISAAFTYMPDTPPLPREERPTPDENKNREDVAILRGAFIAYGRIIDNPSQAGNRNVALSIGKLKEYIRKNSNGAMSDNALYKMMNVNNPTRFLYRITKVSQIVTRYDGQLELCSEPVKDSQVLYISDNPSNVYLSIEEVCTEIGERDKEYSVENNDR